MSLSRRRLLTSAAGLSAVAVGLSACNASARSDGAAPTAPAHAGGVEDGAYPVTIKHKFGETTITTEPKRVVTAGLKEQDDCLALGVVPVASTTWFDLGGDPLFGAWAKDELGSKPSPTVLSSTDKIEFEKIAAATPDVIIALYSGVTQSDYDKLTQIAPTVVQSADYSDYRIPWDVQATIVGQILGRPAKMAELVSAAKRSITDAGAANSTFTGKSGIVATPWEGVFVYGSGDPRSRMLTDLGLVLPKNMDDQLGDDFGGNLSAERVELLDTDLIIWFVEGDGRTTVESNKAYVSLPVHQESREIFMKPGDGVYEAYSFVTVLSVGYLLEGLIPRMKAAIDGDPKTSSDPG